MNLVKTLKNVILKYRIRSALDKNSMAIHVAPHLISIIKAENLTGTPLMACLGHTIQTRFHCLGDHAQAFSDAIDAVNDGQYVPNSVGRDNNQLTTHRLYDYMVDEHDCDIDLDESLYFLKALVLELEEALEKKKEHERYEYYVRKLTPLFEDTVTYLLTVIGLVIK